MATYEDWIEAYKNKGSFTHTYTVYQGDSTADSPHYTTVTTPFDVPVDYKWESTGNVSATVWPAHLCAICEIQSPTFVCGDCKELIEEYRDFKRRENLERLAREVEESLG